jgi:hypothetical protein
MEYRSRVYYKNLYRYNKVFIGGSLAIQINGIEECAENAKISLFMEMKKLHQQLVIIMGILRSIDTREFREICYSD